MSLDVNRIIEMALDFDEFNVKDPHDPEFHSALAGERVVVYYGTSSKMFWQVIKHGISAGPTVRRERASMNDLSFSARDAKDHAYRRSHQDNNEEHEGPYKPIVFVLETKFQKPTKAGTDEMDQFIAGTSIGAEGNTLLPLQIKPSAITGVFYDGEDGWEIPIKKFIQQVNSGQVEGIEPDREYRRSKLRPQGVTDVAWQMTILRYANDLANYSRNLYQYLVTDEVEKPWNDTIIREATRIGLSRMLHWTGRDMVKWLNGLFPSQADEPVTPEEDANMVMSHGEQYFGWDKPLYRLIEKYRDNTSADYRSGRKGPHSPGGE